MCLSLVRIQLSHLLCWSLVLCVARLALPLGQVNVLPFNLWHMMDVPFASCDCSFVSKRTSLWKFSSWRFINEVIFWRFNSKRNLVYFILSRASVCLENFGDFLVKKQEWFHTGNWTTEMTVQIRGTKLNRISSQDLLNDHLLAKHQRERKEVDTWKLSTLLLIDCTLGKYCLFRQCSVLDKSST